MTNERYNQWVLRFMKIKLKWEIQKSFYPLRAPFIKDKFNRILNNMNRHFKEEQERNRIQTENNNRIKLPGFYCESFIYKIHIHGQPRKQCSEQCDRCINEIIEHHRKKFEKKG